MDKAIESKVFRGVNTNIANADVTRFSLCSYLSLFATRTTQHTRQSLVFITSQSNAKGQSFFFYWSSEGESCDITNAAQMKAFYNQAQADHELSNS